MLITIDPSRIHTILHLIRVGDRVEAKLHEFRIPAFLSIQSISTGGVYGTLDPGANTLLSRIYSGQLKDKPNEVYFATWDKVERIYMRE